MARKKFSTRDRVRIFELHKGCCHICSQKIQVGEAWDMEHVVPWELTRDDTDENVRPAHKHCHKSKTADDVRAIRKADRIKAKHNGTFQKPTTFSTRFKKRIDGRVVNRETGEIV